MSKEGADISDLNLEGLDQPAGGNNGQGQPGGTPAGGQQGGTGGDDPAAKAKAEADAKAAADKKAAEEAEAARKAKEEADRKAAEGGGGQNEPEAVEVDGKKYKLDAEGNALGEDGKVFKTKAELEALVAEGEDEPLTDTIIKRVGKTPVDEKGQPKKYEETEEGVAALVVDLGKEFAKEEFEKLVKSDPEFEEFLEYKKTGGKLEDFIQKKTESWSSVKLDENNEQQLMNVVMADLQAAGMSEAQAKRTAEMYKEAKSLKEFGKEAYNRLVENEKAEETARVKQFEEQRKEYEESVKTHWSNVKDVITKGDINGLMIPEADKEPFFQYLSVAVDDKGNSKRTIERSKLPLGQLLQLDYFQYKGFNLSELVKIAAKNEKVTSLRSRLKGGKPGAGGGEGIDKNKYQRSTEPNVKLEDII